MANDMTMNITFSNENASSIPSSDNTKEAIKEDKLNALFLSMKEPITEQEQKHQQDLEDKFNAMKSTGSTARYERACSLERRFQDMKEPPQPIFDKKSIQEYRLE